MHTFALETIQTKHFIDKPTIWIPQLISTSKARYIVQFVVMKGGIVGNVKVFRSVNRDLDNEAFRVCKNLPKFIPGKHNGKPVNVWYTLPIVFKLKSEPQN